MKKILILTITAGNAHNECAKRMKEKLESMENVEVKIIDLLKSYSDFATTWIADKGYNLVVSRALTRWCYHKFYNHFFKQSSYENRFTCGAQKASIGIINGLIKEIFDFKPDVIYSTHFYGGIAISDMRLVYNIPCPVIVTALDYVYSPFWEGAVGVDYFIIPNEDFIEEGIRKGFTRGQLMPIGLPVDNNSLEEIDKTEARRRLGIDENLTTIMVMFGGGLWHGGFEIFKDLIKSLKGRQVQVIMINGKNIHDYKKIEKMKFEEGIKVVNVGFTDKISLYLSASDIILNKCGGASATEMINKKVPMLLTEKVPTQELYNIKYLKEKGCALSFKNRSELKQEVNYLLDNPKVREDMSKACEKIRKNSIEKLAEFILSFPNCDYSKVEKPENKVKGLILKKIREENKKLKLAVKQEKNLKKI